MNYLVISVMAVVSALFIIGVWFTTMVRKKEGLKEEYTSKDQPTIFVSVASYRDAQCNSTINNLFKCAKYPGRVYVGICEQNEIGNKVDQCVNYDHEKVDKYKANIRRIEISHFEAMGPCLARYYCSLLYRGEDYFMQIDSHSLFSDDWDEILVKMYKECPVENAVFGGYPKTYEERDNKETINDVPLSCHFHFDNEQKMPELYAVQKTAKVGEFFPSPYSGAGFMFGPGKMVIDVPFDPDLPYLFMGEELLYSARLYTHGYNIVMPYRSVVFHDYGRPGAPRFWDVPHNDYNEKYEAVKKKLMYLLKFSNEKPVDNIVKVDERYGMGTKRSIEQYWEYADVDYINKVVRSKEKFC